MRDMTTNQCCVHDMVTRRMTLMYLSELHLYLFNKKKILFFCSGKLFQDIWNHCETQFLPCVNDIRTAKHNRLLSLSSHFKKPLYTGKNAGSLSVSIMLNLSSSSITLVIIDVSYMV